MTGILGTRNGTTHLLIGHRTDVVMTELDEHVVAWLKTVIHLLPSSLIKIRTGTATSLGCIYTGNLLRIEDGVSLRAPAPHAVFFLIGILHSTVACEENNRFARLALEIFYRQSHIDHHRLQRSQTWVFALCQSLGCRTCIHHRSETGGVDMVGEEMILLLPMTITVELGCRNLIQINERNTFLLSHLLCPQAEGLVDPDNLIILIVGITWSQRHQDRVSTQRLTVVDVFAHVFAVSIDGFLDARLLDGDIERILADARDAGTCSAAIVWAIVVMTDGDNHPVACLDALAYIRPQTVVEGTAAHAAQSLVLYGNLVGIKELVLVIAPAPLTVVTITQSTIAHGRVTNEEEHRIVALSAGTRLDACRHRLVQAIHGVINHMVYIFHRSCHCRLRLFCRFCNLCIAHAGSCCHQRHSK